MLLFDFMVQAFVLRILKIATIVRQTRANLMMPK